MYSGPPAATDRTVEPLGAPAAGIVGDDGQAPAQPPISSTDSLAGLLELLGAMVRARVRSLVFRGIAFVVMALFGLALVIYFAANSLYGVTPAELPVLILFTAWFVGTIVALALYVRSEKRKWSAMGPKVSEPPAAPPAAAVPLAQPHKQERGPSLGERVRGLLPFVFTLLATLPLMVVSLIAGALVADPLEAAGVPNSVTFPLGLAVAGTTFVAGTILVFRRLWSRSPVARQRRASAEARRQWIADLDAHLASPAITGERSETPPI